MENEFIPLYQDSESSYGALARIKISKHMAMLGNYDADGKRFRPFSFGDFVGTWDEVEEITRSDWERIVGVVILKNEVPKELIRLNLRKVLPKHEPSWRKAMINGQYF